MKRLIYYPPGCYGTFVNWLCNTDQDVKQDDLPFAEFGNSHKYYDTNTGMWSQKQKSLYLRSNRDFGVLRTCWPYNVGSKLINLECNSNFFTQQVSSDLQQLTSWSDRILILHPTEHSKIWWYHNFCEKVVLSQQFVDRHFDSGDYSWLTVLDPIQRVRHYLELEKNMEWCAKFYTQFAKTTAMDFEIFELRQILAAELHQQTANAYNCWVDIKQDFPQCQFVDLEQLRDNFVDTMHEIFDYFEIVSRVQNSFDYIGAEWLDRQQHKFKDSTVASVVSAVLNQEQLDWQGENFTLFDEVWLEKILRYEHGYEFKPMNTWPTNTKDLLMICK